MTKNTEGLRYPSIDELLKHIDSKYKISTLMIKKMILIYLN